MRTGHSFGLELLCTAPHPQSDRGHATGMSWLGEGRACDDSLGCDCWVGPDGPHAESVNAMTTMYFMKKILSSETKFGITVWQKQGIIA